MIPSLTITPETVLLAFLLLFVFYIAYKIIQMVFKTFLVSMLFGAGYGIAVYLDYLVFEWTVLLLVIITGGGLFIMWQLLQIPIWILKKIKGLFSSD